MIADAHFAGARRARKIYGVETLLLAVYGAGVVIGLVTIDGSIAARLGLSLVWPAGPVAFVLTIAMLVTVAAIRFPTFGVLLAVLLAAVWMLI